MSTYFKTVFLGFALFASKSRSDVICGPIFNAANGHAYYILSENTWRNSEAEAIQLGGHLVTINDQAEQTWIYSTFSVYNGLLRNLWIGLNDEKIEGTFIWSSGESVSYSNWFAGEPNDFGGSEDYIEIAPIRNGAWNDLPNASINSKIFGIVEIAPSLQPKEIWDANNGLVITRVSPLHDSGTFNTRDIFGTSLSTSERGNVIFRDSVTNGYVHFVEWQTPAPVTVKSIRLFAQGDGTGREFASFRLLAKEGSSTFNKALFYYVPPHPYVLNSNGSLIEANVVPTTSRDFRAEFVTYPSANRGPRIMEIDGFDQYLLINQLPVAAKLAVQLKWPMDLTNHVQVQWSSSLSEGSWFNLGPPVEGTAPFADPIYDANRFYRILMLE